MLYSVLLVSSCTTAKVSDCGPLFHWTIWLVYCWLHQTILDAATPLHKCIMYMCCTNVTTCYHSSSDGYHPIQHKISDYNATQCGYCTPGMVMSMYRWDTQSNNFPLNCVSSLLQSNPKPTKQEIEDNFDGNICRCTGKTSIAAAAVSVVRTLLSVQVTDLSLMPWNHLLLTVQYQLTLKWVVATPIAHDHNAYTGPVC